MSDHDDQPEGRRKLARRDFLKLAGATLVAVPACADDVMAGTEGPGGSSTGDGSSTTTSGDVPTTGAPTTSSSTSTGDGTTTSSTGADSTSTGDDGTTSTSTGEPSDMGAQPQACEGQEIAFAPDAVAEDLARFPTAVMAGAMRQESALLHGRSELPEPVLLRVWQPGDAEGTVRVVRELEVTPDENGYLRQLVDGLCPGQWYRYGFFATDRGEPVARGVLGEFRTAIADDAMEPLTVAISCCNGLDNFPWPALQRTSDEYYDVFLHLGDMAYNDGEMSLADYRGNWQAYLAVADGGGMALAYARAGLYCTLDDHEVTNDFNPETIDPQRLQDAMTSYFEAIPVTDTPMEFRVWQSFRWGLTAEFIVLDCRTERKPSTANSADPIYLSKEQMAWLKERLQSSPCHFKVILNSVPITDMPTIPWDFAANDRWEGYPVQRQELLDFIAAEDIANVWFLSGDFHTCFISHVEPDGDGVVAKTREIAVTGGNTNILGDFLAAPQFSFGSSNPHGCIITFDPAADEVLVRFIDADSGQDAYSETLTQK
ncbi:alkaline phosphatase D family protein [Nannocystis sp. RBIL2]|uniref:alkaline phosphatase D family protein n=1 Tax=Nannocystis sp. RBIL2 TaxID=2996788 RepID=UPI002270FBD1|nr:alkaline phosphatase D family protein [Nannocystis sp. RBIL2]MCY1072650.1 alkaline phosphatase D family protein [Nannocystis sp. RBIL2]